MHILASTHLFTHQLHRVSNQVLLQVSTRLFTPRRNPVQFRVLTVQLIQVQLPQCIPARHHQFTLLLRRARLLVYILQPSLQLFPLHIPQLTLRRTLRHTPRLNLPRFRRLIHLLIQVSTPV